jgi:hypothetical protein
MNALIRTSVVALMVAVLNVAVVAVRFGYSPSDSQESRRREELQRLEEATFGRLEARQAAVQQYIAQRYTLTDLMQQFQELDHEWPDFSAWHDKIWESEAERLYQHILAFVEVVLRGQAEELALVLRRLEKDYRQLQAGRPSPSPAATERTEQSR